MSWNEPAAAPSELWVNAKNKTTGVVYKTIENCTDLARFAKEEPELSKQILTGLNAWLKADPVNVEKMRDFPTGYRVEIGDYEYKVIEYKDGNKQLSRKKLGGKSSGGGSGRPFTVFRTTQVKFVFAEQVSELINNQGPEDNWEIQYIKSTEEGDMFAMLNKKPYTPPPASAVTAQSQAGGESNVEKQEETTEEEHL